MLFDDNSGVLHDGIVEFAVNEADGSDSVEVNARFEPLTADESFGGVGHSTDDVGFANGGFKRHHLGASFLREGLGMFEITAPDANVRKWLDATKSSQVCAGLDAAAEDSQHASIGRGEGLGGESRDGGGAPGGDDSSV